MKKTKLPNNREEMLAMLKKTTKQPNKKKGTNPIVYIFLLALIISLVYLVIGGKPKENINEKIGLNEVVSNYKSGSYKEVVIEGDTLYGKKPERLEQIIGGKSIQIIDVDKILLPPRDSLKEL